MTISILATCGTTQYDLSSWVIKDSIKIDTHLFTDSLEPNTNSAEFTLSRTCPYIDELLIYNDAIGVSIAADGITYFTGYFTDSFRFAITSRGAQDVKIECEDPGIRKLKIAWVSADGIGTTFAGDKICDPADTTHSVLHKIATLSGVTLASGLPTISQQVYMVVLDKDGQTYWDVLSKLLLEHLYVFDFNAAGQLYLFALTGMTGSPVQTLTTQEGIIGDNSTPGITVNKRLYDIREIDIKFDEISTIVSGVVHRDTTGQTATYDCLIPIAPGAYYPDTCNADTYAYIDYKTEDGRDVVMVDSATLDVSKDSGITAEFANLGKSARIRFYNGGATTQYIYRLKVNATNIRVKSANSKVIAGEASRHKREVDASTITTKAEAQAFGNLLYYYYKNSKQVYQFNGYRGLLYPSEILYPSETLYPNGDLIEPGEIIRLYDPIFTGLDATVMVTRKRYTLGRSGAEYDAIGIGTISLNDTVAHWQTVTPPTLIPGPTGPQGPTGPAGQPAIIANLSNESHTVPTDANGNNGNYTGCATTMSIFVGSTDDSANWTVSASPSAGITGSLSGRTYTVTNMTTDTGYVDLTASKSGYSSITCRFTISKAKGGIAYMLVVSAAAIQKSQSGTYTPSTITVSAKSVASAGTVADYAGSFVIAETTDGTTYTDKYTSSANESSKTYTPSAGIKALRCRLYLAGGTTTLLDEEIIPIVVDGPTGPTGPQGPTGPTGPAGQDAPHYLGLYAYSSRASITGMIANDLVVLYSTTQSERGIYAYISSSWTKQTTPTQDQIMRCMVGVLDAVRQGYGQSSDYIGTGATSFETLLVNFLYAQQAFIDNLLVNNVYASISAGTVEIVNYNYPGTNFNVGNTSGAYYSVGKIANNKNNAIFFLPKMLLVKGTANIDFTLYVSTANIAVTLQLYINSTLIGSVSVTGTGSNTVSFSNVSIPAGASMDVKYASNGSTTISFSATFKGTNLSPLLLNVGI